MHITRVAYLIILLLLFKGCGRHTVINEEIIPEENTNALRFSIKKQDGYTVLSIINPWQGAENIVYSNFLVKRGEPVPDNLDSSKVIFIPVRSIVCMSTTYLTMISYLGKADAIKGISGAAFVYDESLKVRINAGEVLDVGYEDNINKELIVRLSPDIVMAYGIGSESAGYLNKLRELGIKIIYNAEYLEDDPIGKAEWIKVFGALFDKDEEAEEIFNKVLASYTNLRDSIRTKIAIRPKVMLGLPGKDTWFISPGNSYISRLISDAGGDYIWKDTDSEISMPFGIENVYMKASDADFWLNIGAVMSKEEIISVDRRLEGLQPYRKGNLFNNNNRISAEGGNDYWESGALNPQIILNDLAAILHPGLFPDYQLHYYRKIN